jgi:hypothetical protein
MSRRQRLSIEPGITIFDPFPGPGNEGDGPLLHTSMRRRPAPMPLRARDAGARHRTLSWDPGDGSERCRNIYNALKIIQLNSAIPTHPPGPAGRSPMH